MKQIESYLVIGLLLIALLAVSGTATPQECSQESTQATCATCCQALALTADDQTKLNTLNLFLGTNADPNVVEGVIGARTTTYKQEKAALLAKSQPLSTDDQTKLNTLNLFLGTNADPDIIEGIIGARTTTYGQEKAPLLERANCAQEQCTDLGAAAACGDGTKTATEACDDGNVAAGDGCSATCMVETGYGCTVVSGATRSTCSLLCGNGLIDAGEQCDCGADGTCTTAELNGQTCTSEINSATGGTLACNSQCRFDTTACILPPTSVAITVNPDGGAIDVDSIVDAVATPIDDALTTQKTYSWPIGQTYRLTARTPYEGQTGVRKVFTGWTGVSPTTTQTISFTTTAVPAAYTVAWRTEYQLTINVATDTLVQSATGSAPVPATEGGTTTPAGVSFIAGASPAITATPAPNSGYELKGWKTNGIPFTGALSSTFTSFAMSAPAQVTAVFQCKLNTYRGTGCSAGACSGAEHCELSVTSDANSMHVWKPMVIS
jgi:cysteine-rich repeat protein